MSSDKADSLIAALQQSFAMKPLAANPLLLELICWLSITKPQFTLPVQRIDLYDDAVGELLRRKGGNSDGKIALQISVMEEIAYHYFQIQGGIFVFYNGDLLDLLTEIDPLTRNRFFETKERAQGCLDALSESGLLCKLPGERSIFLHLTFQEYFAACHIARNARKDDKNVWLTEIRGHFKDPHWHEVIRLVSAKLGREEAARASPLR